MQLSVSTWKYAKDWVYSITYDEALADLLKFVIPTHKELGIPGHVEVVAGQIGQVHDCNGSSFNGMMHLNAEELKELVSIGWGVGCHSWSHGMVMDNPDLEIRRAKEAIEEAIGRPISIFCSPGNNDNLTEEVREWLNKSGYLAGMSITDDINRPDDQDLLWVNRVPLHERYWGPFDSWFDAHKRVRQAQLEHGWIVDYCHCPLEQAIHDYKDCTQAHQRERLEAIAGEGGSRCWYANPDTVVDYRYMRRNARIEPEGHNSFRIRLKNLPPQMQCRELTFELQTMLTPESLIIEVDGNAVNTAPGKSGILLFTAAVKDNTNITVRAGGTSI